MPAPPELGLPLQVSATDALARGKGLGRCLLISRHCCGGSPFADPQACLPGSKSRVRRNHLGTPRDTSLNSKQWAAPAFAA
jgi:hypothetical protein